MPGPRDPTSPGVHCEPHCSIPNELMRAHTVSHPSGHIASVGARASGHGAPGGLGRQLPPQAPRPQRPALPAPQDQDVRV